MITITKETTGHPDKLDNKNKLTKITYADRWPSRIDFFNWIKE